MRKLAPSGSDRGRQCAGDHERRWRCRPAGTSPRGRPAVRRQRGGSMPASGPAPGRPAPGAPAAAFESLHWRGAEDRRRPLLASASTQRASMAGGAVVDGGEVDATDLANRAPLQWFTTWRWRSRSSSGTARCSLATPSSPPGAFLDPAQSVAHGVGVAVQSVGDGAHRSGVPPHPNRFEECLALLVGRIAETVQSGPDRCDHHMRCPY